MINFMKNILSIFIVVMSLVLVACGGSDDHPVEVIHKTAKDSLEKANSVEKQILQSQQDRYKGIKD